MVPGITDTECRIKQLRYRELHAEAERQRRAALAAPIPSNWVGLMDTLQRRIGALIEQAIRLLPGVHTQEATEQVAAPGTLAVSK
jgi:hypothetical protein